MKNFTLFSLIRIALKHIVILIIAAIVFAGATFAYCEFVALPVYSATGSMLVTNGAITQEINPDDPTLQNTDIIASLNFSDTVIDILKTKGIFKEMAKNIDNRYTYKNLANRTNISRSDNNSLFVKVTISANSSAEAIALVNEYLKIAPEYVSNYVPGTTTVAVNESDSARQTYPRTLVYSGVAGIVGALSAFAILILIYSTNTIIRGEEDFLERFNVQVIGSIPDFANARADKYYRSSYYNGYNGYYGKGEENDAQK